MKSRALGSIITNKTSRDDGIPDELFQILKDDAAKDLLEEEMATLSSILAWRIPWTEDPGGLQSMGLQRVRHD